MTPDTLKIKFHHFDVYLCHTNEEFASTQIPAHTSYIMAGPDIGSAVLYRCVAPANSCSTCPIQNNCSIGFLVDTGHALHNKHINTFKKLA